MDHCEHLTGCDFFNDRLSGMPFLSDLLKEQHCLGGWTSCARFMVAQAGSSVPDDLFPDDDARALQMMGR
jgi:hypothetical protein